MNTDDVSRDLARAFPEAPGDLSRLHDRLAAASPMPVVLPCHRVVRSDGSMGGYLGGADAKRALLTLEAPRLVDPARPPDALAGQPVGVAGDVPRRRAGQVHADPAEVPGRGLERPAP